MRDGCYGCDTNVHVSESEIAECIRKVKESGVPLANSEQYENRLRICRSCDQLLYGTTCMACGCFVKVRALNALRICPHASGSRW